jgi:hypothetical protein
MNDKPIAWMVGDDVFKLLQNAELHSQFHDIPVIPLYTHPATTLNKEEEGND